MAPIKKDSLELEMEMEMQKRSQAAMETVAPVEEVEERTPEPTIEDIIRDLRWR